jgi:hypothetical protein
VPVRTARATRKAQEIAARVETFFRDAFGLDLKVELRYAPTFQGAIFDGERVIYGDGFARADAIAHAVSHSLVKGEAAEEFCDVVASMVGHRQVKDTAFDQAFRIAGEVFGAGSAAQQAVAKARLRVREFVPPAAGAEVPLLRVTRKPPRAAK